MTGGPLAPTRPAWRLACAALLALLALTACTPVARSPATATATPSAPQRPALRLIGTAEIAPGTEVLGSTFGGISGIDYDPARDRWLLISDDRSALQPARFYTATLRYGLQGLQVPRIEGMVALRRRPLPRRPTPYIATR